MESNTYGEWTRECVDCHDPHFQPQLAWAATDSDSLFLVRGSYTSFTSNNDSTTTFNNVVISATASDWDLPWRWAEKSDAGRGLIFVASPNDPKGTFEIVAVTGTSITVQGAIANIPAYQASVPASGSFGLIYGQLIRNQILGPLGYVPVKLFTNTAQDSFAFDETASGTDQTPFGLCQACHDSTGHWRYDGAAADHFNNKNCARCHDHEKGFPGGTCVGCHAVPQGNRAAVTAQLLTGDSHHVQGVELTDAHCYQCHWEGDASGNLTAYHDGPTSGGAVDLVIYGAGTRPAAYQNGVTAIQYTADGSRSEINELNAHCLGCHSNGNNGTMPFGDGKTPKQYAWDGYSIAARYSQTGTTLWGKYNGTNITAKNSRIKAFSAHGNATANQGGWDLAEGWPNTRNGAAIVACYDCHNSHGSNAAGVTTSYTSATANGGLLKSTAAGKGGYSGSYVPEETTIYQTGARLCFDCHLSPTAATTPWGYNATFGASAKILGYFDTDDFADGTDGSQQRYPYKAWPTHDGHFGGASLPLASSPAEQINGLCTPCHDPHGVSPNPTKIADQAYAVPLLKGTWLTSPYKEDAAPAATNEPRGDRGQLWGSTPGYHIDQNTFANWSFTATNRISESSSLFGGLCLRCHVQSGIDPDSSSAWGSMDRVHETVAGWGSNAKHAFPCSKCHTPHVASLPRLMVTNCLDFRHRGRVTVGGWPGNHSDGGDCGGGGGKFPAGGGGGDYGCDYDVGYGYVFGNQSCHDNTNAAGWPSNQLWNTVTPWEDLHITSGPSVGSFSATGANISATISWTTDGQGSSYVDYGLTAQYGTTAGNGTLIANHSVQLSNLVNHTTYHYRVRSATPSTEAASSDGTFTTSVPPSTPALTDEPDTSCGGPCAQTLQWSAATDPDNGPIQYSVQIDNNADFSSPNYTSGWITGMFRAEAHSFTGGGVSSNPRPFFLSGAVTTRAGISPAFSSSSRKTLASRGVPKNAKRTFDIDVRVCYSTKRPRFRGQHHERCREIS
ncbi:hypothetical protein C4556_00720 [Candidatus Parcubacteria bacterium]|nr:MAG: hypothetical protein C4556_00720 [Candidatus Parcubacteria bacterium]